MQAGDNKWHMCKAADSDPDAVLFLGERANKWSAKFKIGSEAAVVDETKLRLGQDPPRLVDSL